MIKTTKNSKSGYNKKIEILKRIQDDIKQNWKAQLPNQKFQGKSWLVRNDRAEEKMLGPEGKVEKLDHEIKEYHPLVKHIWKEHMQDDFNRVQSEKWPRLISLFFSVKKKKMSYSTTSVSWIFQLVFEAVFQEQFSAHNLKHKIQTSIIGTHT